MEDNLKFTHATNYVKPFYEQPHRKYHTFKHIESLIRVLPNTQAYILAALFHDIIYDPMRLDNEERSIDEFKKYAHSINMAPDNPDISSVCKLILATKHPFKSYPEYIQVFVDADLNIFKSSDINELINYEYGIFYEYQKFPIRLYIEKRVEFLEIALDYYAEKNEIVAIDNIKFLIKYIQSKIYKIGIYPGSFNPLHKGHKDIINQAEKIFDKVIVAQGVNTSKNESQFLENNISKIPQEVDRYTELLSNYILSQQNYNVEISIIRGLRNGYDLQYEDTLRKVLKDENRDFKFVYFFCNSEFEHVSSGLIRSLSSFSKSSFERYI